MRFRTTLFSAFCVCVAASTANAAIIINDNFEGYSSQANFEATWVPIAAGPPASAEWSTAQASSPTHSVRTPGTATNSQSRNQRNFAESGSVSASGDKPGARSQQAIVPAADRVARGCGTHGARQVLVP